MGRACDSTVRRVQEALLGGAMSDAERVRVAGELHARVNRLRRLRGACSQVRVSRYVEAMLPSAVSA